VDHPIWDATLRATRCALLARLVNSISTWNTNDVNIPEQLETQGLYE
jgi:hypothetical protein